MTVQGLIRAMPVGLRVAVVTAFLILCGLGTWQMARLHWKEALIADMARTEQAPPVPVKGLLAQAVPAWRSAILPSCTVKPDMLIPMHSMVDGVAGYRILTHCPLAAGQPDMLVDLGFAPAELRLVAPVTLQPIGRLRPFDKPSAFAAVNRPEDRDWYTRDPAVMGKALNQPVRSDYFLVLDLGKSQLALPGLQQGPATAPLTNRHLEYALTWYGLAAALLGIAIAYALQRAKGKAT